MSRISILAVAAALVASATAASVTTTLSPYDERVNLIELAVYVSDIGAHLSEYYAFQALHKTETYPPEIANAVFAGGDFTTMLTGISGDEVTRMITGFPWYSTRLKPAISSALSKDGIYTAIPTSTSTTSDTYISSSSPSQVTSSAEPTTVSKFTSSVEPTRSSQVTSSAEPTTVSEITSSAEPLSFSKATTSRIYLL